MSLRKQDEGQNDIELPQDMEKWRACVNTVMKLRVAQKAQNYLTSWRYICFLGTTLFCVVMCRRGYQLPSNDNITKWTVALCITMILHGRVLLKKLTGSQLVQKFPAFYGTRRFITTFTRTHHLSLSWARSIQSMRPILLPENPS